ncbi:MAG: hypothetical protein E7551_02005 [Ruminococcaceae bacterium]|nr:hypothetical protein [Oscillospiraceae bacterium]
MELIAVLVLILCVCLACRAIYHLFDHTDYDTTLPLDYNAKIVDIRSEKVQYAKNGAKYKTTVLFADGFRFITHKTKRENGFFTYQISIDEELMSKIVDKAISAHGKAVEKQIKKLG